MVAQPPRTWPTPAGAARDVFVIDTSIRWPAPLLPRRRWCAGAGRLRPDDTYQIVRFSDAASALGPAAGRAPAQPGSPDLADQLRRRRN
jgi:hypothetical protein